MSETAAWSAGTADGSQEAKSSRAKSAVVLAAFILALGLSLSTWLYLNESEALTRFAAPGAPQPSPAADRALFHHFQHWVLWVVLGTTSGGAVLLFAIVISLGPVRRKPEPPKVVERKDVNKTLVLLESQLSASRKSEEQLEELKTAAEQRATNLEAANVQLQAELDKVKRTEKALAQQRQVLESSKTVLELHVQSRTRELQSLQRQYEHILISAGEGICGFDTEDRITFVNPAVTKITGWSREELLGKTEGEIFGRRDAAPAGSPDGPGLDVGEAMFSRKAGDVFPVEYIKTPIKENDQVVGAVLVIKDITERKRNEHRLGQKAAELARSNAELEQFAFVASHDLQEPLRKILAFGDRLKSKCEGAIATEARDYLDRMQNAAARMRTLIDDLLSFSRVIRCSEPFASVDLAAAARDMLVDLEVRIEKSGAHVEVGELPTIDADPSQMRRLLLNLVGNALKFQPPGNAPVVKITSRILNRLSMSETTLIKREPGTLNPEKTSDQLCEITVADNGIGLDEQYSEKIFAVFQRLHGRNEFEGTGVGLAICRRITDRHQGTIRVQSQLGKGTSFIITLPVQQPLPKPVS
jgi:PAS domain S-box-containing protein